MTHEKQQPGAANAEGLEPPRMTTDEAREYLVKFMEQHFTDKTFHRYIRAQRVDGGLAGDFAWQMARVLAGMANRAPATSTAGVGDRPVAEVGKNDLFFLRKQSSGEPWPVGTKLYAGPQTANSPAAADAGGLPPLEILKRCVEDEKRGWSNEDRNAIDFALGSLLDRFKVQMERITPDRLAAVSVPHLSMLALMEKAMNVLYPLPNSPHTSVNDYADIKRIAFQRGWAEAIATGMLKEDANGTKEATTTNSPVAYGLFWENESKEILQYPIRFTEEECKSDMSHYSKEDQQNMTIKPLFK
jgi:hypothetical protein